MIAKDGAEEHFFFLHPFRRSAISCVVPAVSMLHLLLLNHFLFMASKNFLVKSLICHKISLIVPFGQASLTSFPLSSVHRHFSPRICVLCVHAVSSCGRKVCASSVFFMSPYALFLLLMLAAFSKFEQ